MNTELSTVDELASEVKAMENVFTDLAAAIDRAKKMAENLPVRYSAAPWGTAGLTRALMDLAEEAAGIKLPALESFAAVRDEITQARALGETADAVQAHGKTEAFRSNAPTAQTASARPPAGMTEDDRCPSCKGHGTVTTWENEGDKESDAYPVTADCDDCNGQGWTPEPTPEELAAQAAKRAARIEQRNHDHFAKGHHAALCGKRCRLDLTAP